MNSSSIIILTTCANSAQANSLAQTLLEKRLAACVQTNSITSTYRWEGKIQQDDEIRLMIKTVTANYDQIEQLIQQNHSYDNPQIIGLPIENGSKEYLNWIETETK